ncbi:putative sugar O-methyltransferase [bacterium]|nr:putative sugar O-methyltransferase [bacterium]MCP5462284.1 putative sugar O-methyltransferase [bacterium]
MPAEKTPIRNNPALLQRLMSDLYKAPHTFRPTNYWQFYERDIVEYLEKNGLEHFRSYGTHRLASFGAGTYRTAPFSQSYTQALRYNGFFKSTLLAVLYRCYTTILQWLGALHPACRLFNTKSFIENERIYLSDYTDLKNAQYRYSELLDKTAGLHLLHRLEDSGIGSPHDLFTIHGNAYTLPFLLYFDRMAYVASQIDLFQINTILEIGSGYGGSTEVYLKAFPHIRYFNFDIPPQIYVAQQYLEAVFPGRVYGYEQYCQNVPMDQDKYRIFCLPAWTLESIGDFHFDLLINTASFQEMEPDIVKNYYELIKNNIDYAYLFELTYGTYKKTSPNGGGAVNPLTLDDYFSVFSDFDTVSCDNFSRIHHPYTHLLLKNKQLKTIAKQQEPIHFVSNRINRLSDSTPKRFY